MLGVPNWIPKWIPNATCHVLIGYNLINNSGPPAFTLIPPIKSFQTSTSPMPHHLVPKFGNQFGTSSITLYLII